MCSNASSGLLCSQRDCNLIASVMWVSISDATMVMEGVAGCVDWEVRLETGQRASFCAFLTPYETENKSLWEFFSKVVLS